MFAEPNNLSFNAAFDASDRTPFKTSHRVTFPVPNYKSIVYFDAFSISIHAASIIDSIVDESSFFAADGLGAFFAAGDLGAFFAAGDLGAFFAADDLGAFSISIHAEFIIDSIVSITSNESAFGSVIETVISNAHAFVCSFYMDALIQLL